MMKNFSLVDRHAKGFANKWPIRVVVSPALDKTIGMTDVEQLAMFWLLAATFSARFFIARLWTVLHLFFPQHGYKPSIIFFDSDPFSLHLALFTV